MWALRAWSMMSTGTSSLCARFQSRLRTLWAITPSLSSSAKRRISSSSFSRCFLLALVQLACKTGGISEGRAAIKIYHIDDLLWSKAFKFDWAKNKTKKEDKAQHLHVLRYYSYLEAVEKMIELLGWEVPRQLGQEIMDILHNSLVLTSLHIDMSNTETL